MMPGKVMDDTRVSIGTLNEKSLHASLKNCYAEPGDRTEVKVDGYLVDILRKDLIIEIQTGNFSPLRRKLRQLTKTHRVHLVHPIPSTRWIIKLPDAGDGRPKRRKSPKHGVVEDLFNELVSFPDLIVDPNFSLEILLIEEEVVRRKSPRRGRRRKDWVAVERRLLDIVESHRFESPAELARFLPSGLPKQFDTQVLGDLMERPRWLAQKVAYCLLRAGVLCSVGKIGNARIYSRNRI